MDGDALSVAAADLSAPCTPSEPHALFSDTLAVLRQQREANADAAAHAATQTIALTRLNEALRVDLERLQAENATLAANCQAARDEHLSLLVLHQETVATLEGELQALRARALATTEEPGTRAHAP